MSNFFLNFIGHYDRDKGLDQGRLRLDSLSEGNLKIWIATSSISTKQGKESFHQRGGLLPPDYRCKGKIQWRVKLTPIYLPNKGVDGNFYPLSPYQVETDRGGIRSDFGIHRDANVPGSLGCIVMCDKRFAEFEAEMNKLRNLGITDLPLFVTYS